MIKKGIDGKETRSTMLPADDCAKHKYGVGTTFTLEQIEFFKACKSFNNKFYKGSIKTVVLSYENGNVKYIGGIKEQHAHGKGKLYYKGNVPFKEGYFRHGMYLGPQETPCTQIFMDDTIEDICYYVPKMDRSILREASESILTVRDVEEYLDKNNIENEVEKIIYRTIVVE